MAATRAAATPFNNTATTVSTGKRNIRECATLSKIKTETEKAKTDVKKTQPVAKKVKTKRENKKIINEIKPLDEEIFVVDVEPVYQPENKIEQDKYSETVVVQSSNSAPESEKEKSETTNKTKKVPNFGFVSKEIYNRSKKSCKDTTDAV